MNMGKLQSQFSEGDRTVLSGSWDLLHPDVCLGILPDQGNFFLLNLHMFG